MKLKFEWDEDKNRQNKRKYGVDFEEAQSIFGTFPFEIFHDPDHSLDEPRYIAIGVSGRGRTLLVVHCENSTGSVIRIISARKANKKEIKDVFGGNL